jgi:Tfp pilus assembly protein PilN
MRAVNLIPGENRRAAGIGGRSDGAVYVVLGTLAALVLMLGFSALESRSVNSKQAQAARLNAEADTAEAKASSLAPYSNFATMKATRIQTVSSLVESRFDWSETMHAIAGTIPSNVWLTKLVGTVSPAVSLEGGGIGTSSLRATINAPAIEVLGCTTTQQSVARMMAQMRALPDVQQVTLNSSEKSDSVAGGGAASGQAGSSEDCRNGNDRFPQFQLVIFFKPIEPATVHTGAPSTQPASPGGGQ